MSRAFVKEPDGDQADDELPELPQSPHTNYVTPNGLAQLKTRLRDLQQKHTILKALKESSEDMSAKLELPQVEREIRYVDERIGRAVLVNVEDQSTKTVTFGAKVTVIDEDDKTQTFMIVGEDEADVKNHKVSWVSPIAKALLGKQVHESAIWQRPMGNLELEIIAIEYPK
jgi:transcription elongation GreA/GreB family factor